MSDLQATVTNHNRVVSPALNKTLLTNAAFSCVSGLIMLFAATDIAALMGVEQIWIFYFVGVGLQVFALDLAMSARRSDGIPLWRAYGFSVSDFAWVLGSIGVILMPGLLTTEGKYLVGFVAVVVFILGELQLIHTMRFAKKMSG